VVAALAKELNALTIAVVTKPFPFEGPRRMKSADKGLADLASSVDTVITIPNEKLLKLVPKGTSFVQAFSTADDILRQAVQGIADIITTPGLINRDFSDIKSIMLGMGYAMMGSASARGDNALVNAAHAAIASPLLDEGGVRGARAMLINITGSSQMSLHEVNDACEVIRQAAEYDDVLINFGIVLDESLEDEVRLSVIATGFPRPGSSFTERRSIDDFAPAPIVEVEPQAPAPEPEPEPVSVSAAAPAPAGETRDDIEMPAFLRRERRLFQ
jgi:cell division protein FtsZ